MIDNKFTEEIAKWLESEHSQPEQIEAGAMLLLRLNRDKGMYQRIMRRPQRELSFLEYKLRRFLGMRRDGQTISDVVRLDNEIIPVLQSALDSEPSDGLADTLPDVFPAEGDGDTGAYVRKGMRPDHDKLPENVQAIWPENAERWKKIKEAFETCKTLTEPCDRYEYLKVLKETWYKYKREMSRYDDYRLTADADAGTTPPNPASPNISIPLTPDQEKELKNADSYISKNLPQLIQLVDAAKEEDFSDEQIKHLEGVRKKMQQRVDVLLRSGRTLTDERREQLISCDIRITLKTPGQDEQGQKSE